MRTLVAAIAAVCLSLGACQSVKADEPSAWHDGAYVGITAGYSAATFKAETLDLAANGLFGGGYAGYGKIVQGIYLGIEVDAMLKQLSGSSDIMGITVKSSGDYLASIRGRVGLPVGPALLYATAGPAMTTMKLSASDGVDTISGSERVFGVVGGVGIDAQITPSLVLRLEGLHYWFPDTKLNMDGTGIATRQEETVIRAGLAFKLW